MGDKQKKTGIMRTSLLSCLLFAFSVVVSADTITDRAKRFLEQKQAKEAYELLQPLAPQRAGDPEFDYLLGIAALDAGDPETAVFALERVLAVQPNNMQARAEIARAYYVMGERESAKQEFETVRRADVPADVRATIERFLGALDRPQTRFAAFLEGTVGVDSNINAATGSGTLAIPAIGTVTLGPGLTRLSDNFLAFSGGASVAHPLSTEWSFVGGVRASARLNQGDNVKTQFDTKTLDADAGARWARDKNSVTVGVQANSFYLDNNRFRDAAGIVGQWQHNLSDTRQVSVFGQWTDLRYPTQSIRDADRTIAGVAYAQSLQLAYSPVVFVSGYFGSEKEKAPNVPFLGHDPYGLRAGVQLTLQPERLFLNGYAGYEERHYGGQEPLFGIARKDRQTDLRVGLQWRFAPGWSLNPEISYTDNRSSVNLFKYDRTVASVSLRKDF